MSTGTTLPAAHTANALRGVTASRRFGDSPVVQRPPRIGRWISGVAVVAVLLLVLRSLVENPHLEWDAVGRYLTAPSILEGVAMTIRLTFLSVVLGFGLGTVLALLRLSGNPVLVGFSWGFTWLFRSVPMLVQLFVWYNIAALYPKLAIALPGLGTVWSTPTNDLIGPFSAALLALVLHEAAYASEVIRAGIIGVPRGQIEAARSLGMTRLLVLRRIVLPQAMRTILPPAGNLVIGQLKTTAVVSVIALQDLLYSAQIIYTRTYEVVPLLVVASLWYIAMTSLLSVGQYFLERHYGRGRGSRGTEASS